MVLNLGPLDWESSTLTTRLLLMLINLEISKEKKRNSFLDYFWGTSFWVPIVLDCYYFGSGWDKNTNSTDRNDLNGQTTQTT